MQTNLNELTNDPEDKWLEAIPDDMKKVTELVQDDLVKPTANLADLMYKSVEIRDSRHSLQLNTSLWRLSWMSVYGQFQAPQEKQMLTEENPYKYLLDYRN